MAEGKDATYINLAETPPKPYYYIHTIHVVNTFIVQTYSLENIPLLRASKHTLNMVSPNVNLIRAKKLLADVPLIGKYL